MNTFLTACRSRSATAIIAVVVLAAGTHATRADYLVRTYADTAPTYLRSPLLVANVGSLSPASREPLTVYRPHEDAVDPASPALDEASLAAALQLILVGAIPPPVGSVLKTGSSSSTQPPVPPPPQLILPPPPGSGGGGSPGSGGSPGGGGGTAEAPEPASLLTALVSTGLAGIALWQWRGTGKKRRLELSM